MLSEGQEHDSKYAINILENLEIEGSNILGDKGYDSGEIIDYIHRNKAFATIPSKSNRKVKRECDWWIYKERHLVEKYFLKLKNFRRIATRYDKLAHAFLGFICIASILIWLK